ncbi:MAG: dihydroxyacetone kinase subunit DhaK [Desulfobacula sp.]|uniref:dihydroxyacetone kinase subunit DhaK n=1 Tax=Desulfobacula sp. TaxID=2593537 RepID=UPI0025BE34A7|nr:dihydroxyacetone kinase subunit DhaK [Desulfobacula sp.]MCD4719694.1 dihydroxyacetone kinase subunit DhaK [Desulfobacula sp.]
MKNKISEIMLKKIINSADTLLIESINGFGRANFSLIDVHENPLYINRKDAPLHGKVALVSGGGSGHEPLHIGYVGYGMLHAACPGEIFSSPTPDQILAAVKKVDGGAGVLFIIKNYDGDRMNFEIASELLDIEHSTLIVCDEALPPDLDQTIIRRGLAGTVIIEKIVGAAAQAGADLYSCKQLGKRVNRVTRTMGMALTGCRIPAASKSTFNLADNEVEMGVGIHGEPGRKRIRQMRADDLVHELIEAICIDLPIHPGVPVLLHVNGFGGTPLIELHVVYQAAFNLLEKRGLLIARSFVGNYTTSLEMKGCSITVTIFDDELLHLWDAPVHTASLCWGY